MKQVTDHSQTSLDSRWEKSFKELAEWVSDNGSVPRRRSPDTIEHRLANWLNIQRTHARKSDLSHEREARLRTIPGALELRIRISDVGFAASVATFHSEHHRLPRRTGGHERTVLKHVQRLRAKVRDGSISPEALAVFAAIPGAVDRMVAGAGQPRTPQQRLEELEEYVKSNRAFPGVASGGLSHWGYRALRGKTSTNANEAEEIRKAVEGLRASNSDRTGAGTRERILKLLSTASWRNRGRPHPTLATYLDARERYVAVHGHLPSAEPGRSQLPMDWRRLRSVAQSATTDADTRERIRLLLAATPWRQRPNILSAQEFEASRFDHQGDE